MLFSLFLEEEDNQQNENDNNVNIWLKFLRAESANTKWSPSGHQVVTNWSVNSGCHKLSENMWFAWSNTCYKGEKVRCQACPRTDGNVKIELESVGFAIRPLFAETNFTLGHI